MWIIKNSIKTNRKQIRTKDLVEDTSVLGAVRSRRNMLMNVAVLIKASSSLISLVEGCNSYLKYLFIKAYSLVPLTMYKNVKPVMYNMKNFY